jgi:hypothetical protein
MKADSIQIRRLTEADAAAYRAIRLEGLRDSPEAFGSTFEAENEHPLEWFANRTANAEVFGAFRGADLLQLTVVSGNESARQLYLHLGFVEYGIERHALKQGERYYDELLMAMDLTPDSRPAAAPAPKG